jgi:hypothetical protein
MPAVYPNDDAGALELVFVEAHEHVIKLACERNVDRVAATEADGGSEFCCLASQGERHGMEHKEAISFEGARHRPRESLPAALTAHGRDHLGKKQGWSSEWLGATCIGPEPSDRAVMVAIAVQQSGRNNARIRDRHHQLPRMV